MSHFSLDTSAIPDTESGVVAVISTGGTIACIAASEVDLAWYRYSGRRAGIDTLVANLPADGLAVPVHVVGESTWRLGVRQQDWIWLARIVQALVRDPRIVGVVVTHGTASLEETAYFLWLTVQTDKPVVLTGSMRPQGALSSDGPANLYHACSVAADPNARDKGVMVVMNATILSARDVVKTDTFALESFQSPGLGPIGMCDVDGTNRFLRESVRATPLPYSVLESLADLAQVDVIPSYVTADGGMVEYAARAGARGIVVAGMGFRPTESQEQAIDAVVADGVCVCISARGLTGYVPRSEEMVARGLLTSGRIGAYRARILLSLALTFSAEPDELQKLIDAA